MTDIKVGFMKSEDIQKEFDIKKLKSRLLESDIKKVERRLIKRKIKRLQNTSK